MRALLYCLLLAAAASAQQVYAVAHGVFYLPHDGVALSSRTGRVRWRFISFDGQTWSDGRGHLLIAYLTGINHVYHLHITRICQLHVHTGLPYWCHEVLNYRRGMLDTRGKIFYLFQPGKVSLYQLGSGRKLRSFHVPQNGEVTLATYPQGGMLALAVRNQHSRLWFYRRRLHHPLRLNYAAQLLMLRQADNGALLLEPRTGSLLLAQWHGQHASVTALSSLPSPKASGAYPRLSFNRQGWILADRQPQGVLLTGGRWRHQLWRNQLPGNMPHLLTSDGHGLLMQPGVASTRLRWLRLANGRPVWHETIAGHFGLALARKRHIALFGPQRGMLLLRRHDGHVLWRDPQLTLVPLLLTAHRLLGWQGDRLEAWSLRDHRLLWKVRFRLAAHLQPSG